jgi:hypothetical protein
MKPVWIGDRRDRVKWAALVHLARREAIRRILTIPFMRDDTPRGLHSTAVAGPVPLPSEVWSHFSDVGHFSRLAASTGLEIKQFADHPWAPPRQRYIQAARQWVVSHNNTTKILFLDPDTGLEPDSGADLKHVKRSELSHLWNALTRHDWLVLYQHGARNSEWRENGLQGFCGCCSGRDGEFFKASYIANDVVMYAARR